MNFKMKGLHTSNGLIKNIRLIFLDEIRVFNSSVQSTASIVSYASQMIELLGSR